MNGTLSVTRAFVQEVRNRSTESTLCWQWKMCRLGCRAEVHVALEKPVVGVSLLNDGVLTIQPPRTSAAVTALEELVLPCVSIRIQSHTKTNSWCAGGLKCKALEKTMQSHLIR